MTQKKFISENSKEFGDLDIKELDHMIHNHPITAWTFMGHHNGKGYTFSQMKKIVEKVHEYLKKKGQYGEITINALIPYLNISNEDSNIKIPKKIENRPGFWRNISHGMHDIQADDLDLNSEILTADYWGTVNEFDIPDRFEAFQIVLTKKSKPLGGCESFYNDCFYYCLIDLAKDETIKAFPSPESLKRFLKLKRTDKVPLNKIELVEKALDGYKIEVIGDYQYVSSKKAIKTIPLKLINGHYNVNNERINIKKGISKHERIPVAFKYLPDDPNHVLLYHNNKIIKKKYDKFTELKRKCKYGDYVFVKFKKGSLKETLDNWIKDADTLKKITDGKYNLYKNETIPKCVVARFFEFNKTLIADEIDPIETSWILNSFTGPLMWAQKGYRGKAYEADMNYAYGTILRDNKFGTPIKKGIYKTLTKREFENLKYYEYGIYHCIIENINYKLMRGNDKNYYTHYDLQRAKELKYKIKLIEDGQPNLLSYAGPDMRVNGDKIFREIIDELFELKQKNKDSVLKRLSASIWGGLCQKNSLRSTIGTDIKKPAKINDNGIISIVPIGSDKHNIKNYVIKSLPEENIFDTHFGRIAPFLTSRIRYIMSKIIEPILDDVIRIQTDGFMSKKDIIFEKSNRFTIANPHFGSKIGEFKKKKCDYIEIIHVNKIVDKDGNKAIFK